MDNRLKILLVAFILSLAVMVSVNQACPMGDLNDNCKVDIEDMEIFAQYWLSYPDCFGAPGCADLVGNDQVNLLDFAVVSENWLLTNLPTLVINEVMASNDSTIEDPDEPGEYPDWFEMYNYGNETVDMVGMTIADDNNQYVVPGSVLVDPGEHVVFWADDDDEQGSRHTNFKLSADGDELSLFTPVALGGELVDSVSFGEQQTDISYGRFPDRGDDWYFMDDPTPGTSNTTGMAGEVYFSRLGGTFISNFSLALSALSPTATIRYTTDGTMPGASSSLYSSPISITNTQTRWIRARVYDAALAPGPVSTHCYIPLASDVQGFSSNLPLVIIDTLGVDIDNNGGAGCWDFTYPYQTVAAVFVDTDKTGQAAMTDLADYAGRGGMRIRGESSRCWPKRQYSFEVWGENYDEDKDVSLLGLPADSDWILNAPYGDKTLLRNVLAYKWSNDIGQYAPRTRMVELYYNYNGQVSSSDYRGVYVLTEKIKICNERVDIAALNSGDITEPEITGGYMIRHDKDNGQEKFTTSANMTGDFQYYDPDEFNLSSGQKNWLTGWLNEYEGVLQGSNFNDPITGYAKYIDIEAFIEYDEIVELFKNADGHKLSVYLYKDRQGKLVMGPQWDYNFSAGNTTNPDWWYPDWFSKTSVWYSETASAYAWYFRLLEDPDYKLRYADKWFDHREDKLSDAQVNADIDYYYTLLTADGAADRNFTRWDILNQYEWCNYYYGSAGNPHTFQMEIEWLKNWFTGEGTPAPGETYEVEYSDRFDWLDTHWTSDKNVSAPPAILVNSTVMNSGGQVNVGDSLTMSTSSPGTIYYTLDGSDPRTWTQYSATPPFITMLVPENADKAVHVPSASVNDNWKGGGSFDDSGWNDYSYISGMTGGVGYENSSGYEPFISYDVMSLMLDSKTSCYIRVPFTVDADDLNNMEYMTLRVRFDDAFAAYINGTEVQRSPLAPEVLDWDSAATNYTDPETTSFIEYDLTAYSGVLNVGSDNILAIHGMNSSAGSSDILVSFELEIGAQGSGLVPGGAIAPTAVAYTGAIPLNESTQIKARIKNGSEWSALNKARFSVGSVSESLRVSEIMYHPAGDPNSEFIELINTGPTVINLNLVEFSDGIEFIFPDMTLAASEYVVVVKSLAAFNTAYPGYSGAIAGEYLGSLSNSGEEIVLKDVLGQTILQFEYNDGWFPVTDGHGFSLNISDPGMSDMALWSERQSWQASVVTGGSPGQACTPPAVVDGAIVINEVLTHTDDLVYGDWIELYNTTAAAIDMGGWFLSDDNDDLMKYEIASGVSIPAYGYLVFTASQHFRNASDPGSHTQFGLSELGERVIVSSGSGGVLSGGYCMDQTFNASSLDVTIGRYVKSAAAGYNVDFVAMAAGSKGFANSGPLVGSVVINEIMYNASAVQDSLGEYIELYNRSGSTVTLYDMTNPDNTWQFTKGIDFSFPSGTTISPGEHILVVRTDPDIFRTIYGVSGGIQVFGPYENNTELDNGGEKIELSLPGTPEPDGTVPYIRVEQVNYSDGEHPAGVDPWPGSADGGGDSLHRLVHGDYANDVVNWQADSPTPGS